MEADGHRRSEGPLGATWGAGRAVVATLVALAVGLFLSMPVLVADAPESADDLSSGAMAAAQAMTVLGFVAVPLWVAFQAGGGPGAAARRLGLRSFDLSALGWMVVATMAYLTFVAVYALVFITPEQEDIASDFGSLPVQILLIVIAASVSEELCFRGMLFGGLRSRMGSIPAAFLASAMFGALHATTGVSAVPPLLAFGFILALLYERTGSLWPAIILHALNNSLALWALHST